MALVFMGFLCKRSSPRSSLIDGSWTPLVLRLQEFRRLGFFVALFFTPFDLLLEMLSAAAAAAARDSPNLGRFISGYCGTYLSQRYLSVFCYLWRHDFPPIFSRVKPRFVLLALRCTLLVGRSFGFIKFVCVKDSVQEGFKRVVDVTTLDEAQLGRTHASRSGACDFAPHFRTFSDISGSGLLFLGNAKECPLRPSSSSLSTSRRASCFVKSRCSGAQAIFSVLCALLGNPGVSTARRKCSCSRWLRRRARRMLKVLFRVKQFGHGDQASVI